MWKTCVIPETNAAKKNLSQSLVSSTQTTSNKCQLLSHSAVKMSPWCHRDWHRSAGDRLLLSAGMRWGSYCYQEVWRSDGLFCLWRASEWRTPSTLVHPSSHLDPSPERNDNGSVCVCVCVCVCVLAGGRSDRKCTNQCWVSLYWFLFCVFCNTHYQSRFQANHNVVLVIF